jgi:hypothetical protein
VAPLHELKRRILEEELDYHQRGGHIRRRLPEAKLVSIAPDGRLEDA